MEKTKRGDAQSTLMFDVYYPLVYILWGNFCVNVFATQPAREGSDFDGSAAHRLLLC
mgnify:CR=1 FL=1